MKNTCMTIAFAVALGLSGPATAQEADPQTTSVPTPRMELDVVRSDAQDIDPEDPILGLGIWLLLSSIAVIAL